MADPKTEYAWVIELAASEPAKPIYFVGISVLADFRPGEGIWPSCAPAWSPDHLRAMRFARQADAEQMRADLRFDERVRVCEHGWG